MELNPVYEDVDITGTTSDKTQEHEYASMGATNENNIYHLSQPAANNPPLKKKKKSGKAASTPSGLLLAAAVVISALVLAGVALVVATVTKINESAETLKTEIQQLNNQLNQSQQETQAYISQITNTLSTAQEEIITTVNQLENIVNSLNESQMNKTNLGMQQDLREGQCYIR